MKINRTKLKNGDEAYYLADTVRKNGKVTTVNIKSLGKRSELLDKYDDPYESLKKYAKELTMEKLLKEQEFTIKILQNDLNEENHVSNSKLLNIGHFYISEIIDRLELKSFFNQITKDTKIEFDAYEVTKFLIIDRILNPQSKLKTFKNLENYYEQPQIELQHFYRVLDLIEENIDNFQKHLYEKSQNIFKRNTNVLYYDCTNFYFEMKFETDFIKYGFGKENRKKPLVGLGLFMDTNGIPLAFSSYEGNTNEQETLRPVEKQIIRDFKISRFILITDAGLSSSKNRAFNSWQGRDFIATESIRKLNDKIQDVIFDEKGLWINAKETNDKEIKTYTLTEIMNYQLPDKKEFKNENDYKKSIPLFTKEFIIDKPINFGLSSTTINNRITNKTSFKQRLIITIDPLYKNYQQIVRDSQVEKAKKIIIENKKTSKELGTPRRYIKEEYSDYERTIDNEQIDNDTKYDGFYALATSLMNEPTIAIINAGSFRWKIEDLIRILKFYLKTRPMYHRKEPRIKAHIAICYTALLIIRLLDMMLGEEYTTEEILKQLKVMKVHPLNDSIFKSTYDGSKLLFDLDKLLNKELSKTAFTNKELNKMK